LPEESQYIWKNIIYYHQSKKDVILEAKNARINCDIKFSIGRLQEAKKEFKHGMD
jgi:hypothetical protein